MAAVAQVTIGLDARPERAALLDLKTNSAANPTDATHPDNVTSSAGGLALPRVKLRNLLTMEPFIPLTDPEWINGAASRVKEIHAGLVVYNLTSDNNFTPGFYMWDGKIWSPSDTTVFHAGNGIVQSGDTFQLGGRLIAPVTINTASHSLTVDRSGAGAILLESHTRMTGTLKYTNGSPGDTKRLASDAAGNASWQSAAPFVTPRGVLTVSTDYVRASNLKNRWRDTKSYIELPPGRWMVMVTMLASIGGNRIGVNDRAFINTTFINEDAKSSGAPNLNDFIGSSHMISGAAYNNSNIMSGYVVIQNNSNKTRKYHYYVGQATFTNDRMQLSAFGSSYWKVNSIMAFAMVE
jgi:hypothetical protein